MSGEDLLARIERALAGTRPAVNFRKGIEAGSYGDLPRELRQVSAGDLVPAAVLVPIVEREEQLSLLLTQRAEDLKHHPGQISFPGGRLEPGDTGPLEAALRETEEEIGLAPEYVRAVGFLDPYITITGYAVIPVVGFVSTGFSVRPDGIEVTEVFEVPLPHMLDPREHQRQSRRFRGTEVSYYEIYYGRRRIWGATAAMIVRLATTIREINE